MAQLRGAPVGEASSQPPHQADRSIGGAEQQRAGIRGNLPTVEGGHHLTALDGFKIRTDRGYTLSASGISSGLV